MIRYGPQYNEIGYYISPSYAQFQETILLDGITESTKYKYCPNKWNDIKTIKGISFCVDQFKKAIEIQIEASDFETVTGRNEIRSIASIGGFTSIQDENQLIINSTNSNNSENSSIALVGNVAGWVYVLNLIKLLT